MSTGNALLVLNNSKVVAARLPAFKKESKGQSEVMLLSPQVEILKPQPFRSILYRRVRSSLLLRISAVAELGPSSSAQFCFGRGRVEVEILKNEL